MTLQESFEMFHKYVYLNEEVNNELWAFLMLPIFGIVERQAKFQRGLKVKRL